MNAETVTIEETKEERIARLKETAKELALHAVKGLAAGLAIGVATAVIANGIALTARTAKAIYIDGRTPTGFELTFENPIPEVIENMEIS